MSMRKMEEWLVLLGLRMAQLDDSLASINAALDGAIENVQTAVDSIRETLKSVDSPEMRADLELEIRAVLARQDGWLEEIGKLMQKGE